MLPLERPDRIDVAFDDHRLVANAGLLLPVTMAGRLGLSDLVDSHVDLGDSPGRANTGDKMLTLVASALAGGDCIDDADALRSGRTGRVLGCVVKAPSTLGTFLRSFRWGHVHQLNRVSRELLVRAWDAGAGPGDGPLTIDLDSTICETYGLGKEGARRHGYTGQRGYHPLQLSRLHHRPRGRHPPTGGRPSPPRRDRKRHPRPQVRRGTEPSPIRTLCRQRRLDGRPGHCTQPRPLDRPHRSGRAGGDHQDPQTTLLRPGRTAHSLGTPPYFASPPALALGEPVQWSSDPTALPAASRLTPLANDPPTPSSSASQPKVSSTRTGWTDEGSLPPPDPP